MKKADFLALVLSSVVFLKEKATPEELAKLDFDNLDPISKELCILGQMTGRSDCERAKELKSSIISIDRRIFKRCEIIEKLNEIASFSYLIGSLYRYKEPMLKLFSEEVEDENFIQKQSAFEHFILFTGANNEELIQFLKGERETFEPKIEVFTEN